MYSCLNSFARCLRNYLKHTLVWLSVALPLLTQAQEIIIDNANAGTWDSTRKYAGVWCTSPASGYYGSGSLVSCGTTREVYQWYFNPPRSGEYDVYIRWTSAPTRSTAVPIVVSEMVNPYNEKLFNQQVGGGTWVLHGRYRFGAGTVKWVQVSDANGEASADAVRFVSATTVTPPPSTQSTLSVGAVNAAAVAVRIYPADSGGLADGTASLTRRYNNNTRVWLSAPLRAGSNYFVKWQQGGIDYDNASTTSVLMDASRSLTAVYAIPSCSGIAVFPSTDSIKSALAAAAGGSTFCIKAGIHRFNSSVVARANDKFIGEPGAILSGSKLLSSFSREGSYWVANGQAQQEPPFPTSVGPYPVCETGRPECIYPEKVFRNGQDLVQVTRLADLRSGTFFFDYTNDKIYLFDDPAGQTIEATTGAGGIIGYNGGGQHSVTIRNLIFEKFGGGEVAGSAHHALKASEGWLIENNEFRYIANASVANFGNGVVRNNHVHHSGKYGVIGGGLLEGNIISDNNIDGFSPNVDGGGTKFHGTRGLSIRGNIVADNVGRGLWTDYDNIDTLYENNIVQNNREMGIFHEVSCRATIKNNVTRGNNSNMSGRSLWNGGQIFLRSSKDTQIFGNDVTAAGPGVHGISLRGGDPLYSGPNCGTIELRNVTASNNTIRLDSTDLHGVVGGAAGFGAAYNVKFTANTYYLQNLSAVHFWYDAARSSMTKEQWQSAGQDLAGKFVQY